MTDHLEEARQQVSGLAPWVVDGSTEHYLIKAIEHLADAIAELRGEDREDAELMRSVRNMYAKIPPPVMIPTETVPELLPEHRDRVWLNRLGRRWRFNAISQMWETLLETIDPPSWAPATTDESGQWATDFGPYTVVPS